MNTSYICPIEGPISRLGWKHKIKSVIRDADQRVDLGQNIENGNRTRPSTPVLREEVPEIKIMNLIQTNGIFSSSSSNLALAVSLRSLDVMN